MTIFSPTNPNSLIGYDDLSDKWSNYSDKDWDITTDQGLTNWQNWASSDSADWASYASDLGVDVETAQEQVNTAIDQASNGIVTPSIPTPGDSDSYISGIPDFADVEPSDSIPNAPGSAAGSYNDPEIPEAGSTYQPPSSSDIFSQETGYDYQSPEITDANMPGETFQGVSAAPAAEYNAPEEYRPAEEDTVAGRTNQLLDENSALMQKASKSGERQAQARGLLDTSLASGYSTSAMMDYAVPIATTDAQMIHEAGMAGYQGKIEASLANLNYENQASLQNLQGQIESQLSRQNALQTDYINQRQTVMEGLVSSGLSKQEAAQNLQAVEYQGMINAGLSAQEAQQELLSVKYQGMVQSGLSAQEAAQMLQQIEYEGLVNSGLSAQEAQQQLQAAQYEGLIQAGLSEQDAAEALELDDVQQQWATYRAELQLEAEKEIADAEITAEEQRTAMTRLSDLGSNFSNAISQIQMQPDLDRDAKNYLVKQQEQVYQNNVDMLSSIYGMDVSWGDSNDDGDGGGGGDDGDGDGDNGGSFIDDVDDPSNPTEYLGYNDLADQWESYSDKNWDPETTEGLNNWLEYFHNDNADWESYGNDLGISASEARARVERVLTNAGLLGSGSNDGPSDAGSGVLQRGGR